MKFNILEKKSSEQKRLGRYFRIAWFPLFLILLFIIQNRFFNDWQHITSGPYLLRFSLVTLSLGIIIYGPVVFFKKRSRYVYLFSVSLVISLIFLTQFIYLQSTDGFLQASAIKYVGQALAVAGAIKIITTLKLLFFFSGPIFCLIYFVLTSRGSYENFLLSQKEKISAIVLLLTISLGGYCYLFAVEKNEWGNTNCLYSNIYDFNDLVDKVGIINFSFEDTIKYLLKNNGPKPSDINLASNWVKNKTEINQKGKYSGIAKNRNIILIQIESLENAVIGSKISGQEITPVLNRLAKEGLYFNNYYAEVGPGNTADTEFVALNSLYALPDDVAFVSYAKNQYLALPQLLKKEGYFSSAFHGDVPTFWNRANIYPNLGYDQWVNKKDYTLSRPIGGGPSNLGDQDFFDQSAIKLKNLSQPFMATLITLSSHTPFQLPSDLRSLSFSSSLNLNNIQQEYLESIHYADQSLGGFIDKLKQTDLYNNSLIIIYGDHGSGTDIGEALEKNNQRLASLRDNNVPLVVLIPKTNIRGNIFTPASHLDLYPTIADLVGATPPKSILGKNILNDSESPIVTHRNRGSGTINAILTARLAYEASPDGIYENGLCLKMPRKEPLLVDACRDLYSQQSTEIKISDVIVRGNLLHLFIDPIQVAQQKEKVTPSL